MAVRLFMSCPACYDSGYNTKSSQWYHTDCGGTIYLNDYAELECYRCSHKSHISKWNWKCDSGRHEYRIASSYALAQAMSTSSQMITEHGLRWLRRALKHL